MWTIQVLGGLAAHSNQRQLTRFRTQKAASLLAYLAFHAAPQPREMLIGMLWPDVELDAGRHNLSNALSFLWHLLEPPGVPPGTVVLADRASVSLNSAAVTVDVVEFERELSSANLEGLSDDERQKRLLAAAEWYQGALLPGYYEEWVAPEALRLESLFVQGVIQLVPLLLNAGKRESALAHAQRAAAADPLSEDAALCLMQTLVASSQPAQALRAFRQLETRLKEELDAEPSPALQSLMRQLGQSGSSRPAPDVPQSMAPTEQAFSVVSSRPNRAEAQEPAANTSAVAGTPGSATRDRLVGAEFLLRTTTRFFGREQEIARLGKMLSAPRTRLVTLTGSAGTGKTRLALEVSAYLVDSPMAGTVSADAATRAVFVPLAPVTEPDRLFDVTLRSLGIVSASNQEPLDQIASILEAHPNTLLVLDNFEQLVDDGALRVRDLMAKAASVKLLVTSRQRLQIEGERAFHLAPLPTSGGAQTAEELIGIPSVALFVDRAQAARPDFQLTERNAAIVSQLCDYLEGIPLAIELAAARVGVLTPSRILEQVSANRLDFLASRQRDTPARHRTLRATLDWSYRLLPEAAQRFLAQVSVFRGGWTLAAAQEVCQSSEQETLEWLMLLRDSSLIGVVDTEVGLRFTFLETIREYAAQQLEFHGLSQAACRRHAAYFVAVVEGFVPALVGPQAMQAVCEIGREHENFRAALGWEQAHRDDPLNGRQGIAMMRAWIDLNWMQLGRWLSGLRERELADAAGEKHELFTEPLASLLFPLAGLTGHVMDSEEALAQMYEVARLSKQRDEPAHAAWVLIYIGYLAMHRSLSEARNCFEEALTLMRQVGRAGGIAIAQSALSCVLSSQGEYERAAALSDEALAQLRERRETIMYGTALAMAGLAALFAGDLARARDCFEQNAALHSRIEDRNGLGLASLYLGMLTLGEGDYTGALRWSQEAISIFTQIDWEGSSFAAQAMLVTARAQWALGQSLEATAVAKDSLRRFRRLKSRYGWASIELLAEVAAADGQPVRAARLLGASWTMMDALGRAQHRAERERQDVLRASLREVLGKERLEREVRTGKTLTEQEAIALALEKTPLAD